MPPTPYPDLNAVLDNLVAALRADLGDLLIGVYLQGSFAVGDFDEHSDADFIAVTTTDLPAATVDSLQRTHARLYALPNHWAIHLEGSYFPATTLKSLSSRGTPLWFLDHGSQSLINSDHCNTAVVRWVVREHGISLIGPPPQSLIDPVSAADLRAEIRQTITDWGRQILANLDTYRNHFYQGYIVLSYCRMLHSLHTGTVESKRAGANWAKDNLDPSWRPLIDRAWNGRPDPASSVRQPPDPADFDSTLSFVQHVIDLSQSLKM